jgi:2-dehydropantoate 2-reductase
MYQLICQFDAIKTSMLVDKEKDRPLETAAISGAVLRRCRQLGIPAPLTAMVDALLTTFPK